MKNKTKKIVIAIFISIATIIWIIYVYNEYKVEEMITPEEQAKIEIDEYNFEQLDKVKNILDWLDKNSYGFENLKEFNEKFNENIESIKNCYFLSDKNRYFETKSRNIEKWKWWYIFWFKLESDKYIKKYWDKNYAYPKYDLPVFKLCFWVWDWWCYDDNKQTFIKTISKPCNK